MTAKGPRKPTLSAEAEREIERYRRMIGNRSAPEDEPSSAEGHDEQLLRDRPPHWG